MEKYGTFFSQHPLRHVLTVIFPDNWPFSTVRFFLACFMCHHQMDSASQVLAESDMIMVTLESQAYLPKPTENLTEGPIISGTYLSMADKQ